MLKALEHKIDSLLQPGFFLVHLLVKGSSRSPKVFVIIDGDNGVTIDDCADLSRKLNRAIEEDDLIEGKYTLNVSSPGLDQPLKLKRQYKKNIGRKVKVTTTESSELKGELIKVTDDFITVIPDEKKTENKNLENVEIPFSDIKKTNILISFKS